jgi:O-antigen/teichoic acid export membrane protein
VRVDKGLFSHGAIVLAGTLITNLLGYAFHFAMSRLLGVTGYGSMLGLFSVLTLIGIPALVAQTVVAKTIAGFSDVHRVDQMRGYVRFLVPIAAGTALVVATILCLSRGGLVGFLKLNDSSGVLIVAWAVMCYVIVPILNGVLQGDQRFRGLAISIVLDALLRAVLAILFVQRGYGVNGALYAISIGATVATILSAIFVSDLLRAPQRPVEPPALLLGFRASIKVSVGILVISTLASVDVLLVKHYRAAYEAGLFGSLALIGRVVYLIAIFVPTIVLPKAAARINEGRSPVPLLLQSAGVFIVALGTVLVPLLAFPSLVLRIVAGNAYASAAPLLALYGSAIAFLAAAYAAANYNIGVNRLGFVYPVIVTGCAEVACIVFKHDSLLVIIEILTVGHFLIFLATIFRIWVYTEGTSALKRGVNLAQSGP